MRDKVLYDSLRSIDLPNHIFRVTKVMKNEHDEVVEIDITRKAGGYFKVLKGSSFSKI